MVGLPGWVASLPWLQAVVLLGLFGSLFAVIRYDSSLQLGTALRRRFLLGVPWGTVVSVLGVLGVYLVLQGGLSRWYDPMTVPFRSWSYLYPLGVLVGPFAHSGPGHLLGNLIGTVVLAPIAEYAWGHFPEERGRTAFASARSNPYVRAFVLFPTGVFVIGLLTGLFSWGPIIGFSGVVFAFAGFALVRYPLTTVVALSGRGLVDVVLRALRNPVVTAEAGPRFVTPWWAGIAVQGHFLGLLLGVVAGVLALRRRESRPARLWLGALLLSGSLSLWALWWYRGGVSYVLYRGLGVVFVLAIAVLVTAGVRARDRSGVLPWLEVPYRQVAVVGLVFPLLIVGFVAVPVNLNTVPDDGGLDDGVEIRGYTVAYAEDALNRMTSVINVSVFGETTQVRTSGVIVANPGRQIWTTAVPASELAFTGRVSVPVGGIGWREEVTVWRRGWNVAGNGTAYVIRLRGPEDGTRVGFVSEPRVADPRLRGYRVAVVPNRTGFSLGLRRGNATVARLPLPGTNETVTAEGIRFVRNDSAVYAEFNGTRIEIATEETYE